MLARSLSHLSDRDLLEAVAEGRLHLSGLLMLAPHLTRDTVATLLAAAEHRTREEIAQLIAERFPAPDVPTSVRPIEAEPQQADALLHSEANPAPTSQQAPGPVPVTTPSHPARVAPLSPGRFELRVTLDETAHEHLRRAQELMSHAVPSGDAAVVVARALETLVRRLERRVCAATTRPSTGIRPSVVKGRRVPSHMKREVWQRDEGRCAYVSTSGLRCGSRSFLQIDHVHPHALGGETRVDNLRLLCRAHDRLEAERLLGERFVSGRCEQARADRALAAETNSAKSRPSAPGHSMSSPPPCRAHIDEVIPALLALKFRRDEARQGAELCKDMADESLAARVKVAIQGLTRGRFLQCTRAPASSP